MKTKAKSINRKYWIWGSCAALLAVVILLLCLLMDAGKKEPSETLPENSSSQPTEIAAGPAPTTQMPTENPLRPEDFAYEGDYLTCLNMPARLGVDVSFWQGDIDWQQVASAGMEFAMIRLGYRGTTKGGLGADDYAGINYENATAAGLQVGGYFFSQAVTPEEAVEEAEFVLDMIRDWNVTMPIVYDWEYGGADSRTANLDARTLTDCTLAFCRTIEQAGYEAMIYFNEDQSHKDMYLGELTDYRFWLAQYGQMLDYPYQVDMWQYTCEGYVPGIDGNVDINLLFAYE